MVDVMGAGLVCAPQNFYNEKLRDSAQKTCFDTVQGRRAK